MDVIKHAVAKCIQIQTTGHSLVHLLGYMYVHV